MKRLLLLIAAILQLMTIAAESDHRLFIFRNNGEVYVFNTAELKSVECSRYDADSVLHAVPVSQCFITERRSVFVPLAEIDSVKFDVPDIIVPKATSMRINDADLPYIKSYTGTEIVYDKSAPDRIIPRAGMRLYYDNFAEVFPYGLACEVKSVARTTSGINVIVEEINPGEIFDEYLVTGDFEISLPVTDAKRRFKAGLGLPFEFNASNIGISTVGSANLAFDNVVISPLTGYYHADITMNLEFEIDLDLHHDDSFVVDGEFGRRTLVQGNPIGALNPRLDMCGFYEFAARLALDFNMKRTFAVHYEWTRRGGKDTFELVNNSNADPQSNTNQANSGIVFDGTAYFGVMPDLSFNILFNRGGAGVSAKVGPSINAEFGMGTVIGLENGYDPGLFAKANINLAMAASLEAYIYHLENIAWGDRVLTHLPIEAEWRFFERTLRLLPEFDSRAVRCSEVAEPWEPAKSVDGVDVASTTSTNIVNTLETGFEVVERSSDNVITSKFVDTPVMACVDSLQGFNLQLDAQGRRPDEVYARPVVKYAGHIIKCRPADVLEGAVLSPIFVSMACNGVNYTGGASIIGQKSKDGTTYVVGNIMPVPSVNPAFVGNNKRTFKTLSFIEPDGKPAGGSGFAIFGNWKGKYKGLDIALTLSSDGKAVYNGRNAVVQYNAPQAGRLLLSFDDGSRLIICIHAVTATEMKISFKSSADIIILTK